MQEQFQQQVRKAETIMNDSKKIFGKVQSNAGKYKSIEMPKFPSDALKNSDPSRFVSSIYSAWKGYLSALEKADISVEELNKMFGGQYESNKSNEIRQVESSGWIVAWGREINRPLA